MLRDPLFDAEPDAELDLHGMTVAEATAAVRTLVGTWRRRRSGAVLHVITGKGRGSRGRPALRPAVRGLLRSMAGTDVADWASDVDDGGFFLKVR